MPAALDKLAFNTAQAARIGWFFGQKLLAARMGRPVALPESLRGRPMPNRQRLLADLRALHRAGLAQHRSRLLRAAGRWIRQAASRDPARDRLFRRSERSRGETPRRARGTPAAEAPPGRYPPYYLQKFHFQSDGYLSDASAERYDHQVEVLFGGGAAAMRRQALVPLKTALEGRSRRSASCSMSRAAPAGSCARSRRTTRGSTSEGSTCRRIISPSRAASSNLGRAPAWSRERRRRCLLPKRNSMSLPASICFTSCRRGSGALSAAEIARVLKPGGTLIFVDSLQTGDEPDYDALLELFPLAFHEPYYASYLREDLDSLYAPRFYAGRDASRHISQKCSLTAAIPPRLRLRPPNAKKVEG